MTRFDIINFFIEKYKYKKYLEIGVQNGYCFSKIKIEYKDSVDPLLGPHTKYIMTSDDYFNQLNKNNKYDIIFIDGLHHDYQVYNDVINSLNHLNDNGVILCHDINPPTEKHQLKEIGMGDWNGDCWKAFVKLRSERNDLTMYTIDTDWGIGVIKRGNQNIIDIPDVLTYDFLEKNRKSILNLITYDDFIKSYDKL